jgi:putative inorganic carbon (HCO3(-)) transporter
MLLVCLAAPFLIFPLVQPVVTALAMTLLAIWWTIETLIWHRPLPITALNGALLIWTTMVGVGTLVTAYPEVTLPKATNLILGIAVWRALGRMPARRSTIRWGLVGLVMMGLGILGLGLLTTNWGQKLPILAPILAALPTGLVTLPEAPRGVNPNQLGGALVIFLPWALSEVLRRITGNQDSHSTVPSARIGGLLLSVAGTAALLVGIVLSQSRSAWMGGAVGVLSAIGLWALASKKPQWRHATLVLLLATTTGGLIAGWSIGGDRLTAWLTAATTGALETSVAGSVSLAGRIEIWSRAIYAIQDFIFTGCGLGAFREVVWVLYPLFTISPGADIAHAHNIFLQVAVDLGIPGLVAYLAIIGIALKMAWRVARLNTEYRALALGLLGGLIALHTYGLTDALAPGSKPGLVLWYVLGILTVLDKASIDRMSNEVQIN